MTKPNYRITIRPEGQIPIDEVVRWDLYSSHQLDIDKMASIVINRPTDCYNGMLETELIKRSQSN